TRIPRIAHMSNRGGGETTTAPARRAGSRSPARIRRARYRARCRAGAGRRTSRGGLLDLHLRALLLEGGLDLLGLLAGDALLDRLGSRVDEILRLLEAEPGQLANDLDDRDLVRTDLGEDRRELGLLLGRLGGGGG